MVWASKMALPALQNLSGPLKLPSSPTKRTERRKASPMTPTEKPLLVILRDALRTKRRKNILTRREKVLIRDQRDDNWR